MPIKINSIMLCAAISCVTGLASQPVLAKGSPTCSVSEFSASKQTIIVRNADVKNMNNKKSIKLIFDRRVNIEKTWGGVKNARKSGAKAIVLDLKKQQKSGSLSFGLKASSGSEVKKVNCQVVGGPLPKKSNNTVKNNNDKKNSSKNEKINEKKKDKNKQVTKNQPATEKCPSNNSGALFVQNFEIFKLGKPSIKNEKAFKKNFCTPLHTMTGFGADSEYDPSDKDHVGRAKAGQKAGAQNFVRVSVVNGPNAFSGKSLKVLYPKGGNTSSHSGFQYPEYIPGTKRYNRNTGKIEGEKSYQEMYISYWVKFENDFTWQLGGKLPGLIAEKAFKSKDRSERVNARLMWRENGKLEFYIHTPYLKKKSAGKKYEDRIFWNNGKDINGHAKLTKGKWHHIEFRVKLNDVVNGKPVPNAELEGWLDGEHAALYTDVTLRGNPSFNFNTFFFSTFFGGSSGSGEKVWWPLKDVYAYFDQIEISDQRIGCCDYNPN